MSNYILETNNLRKEYVNGEFKTEILKGISVGFENGEFCAITGPSGSGKSTLLHILGMLDRPTSGIVKIFGQDMAGLSDRKQATLRRKNIGFIFQSFYLIPGITVYENVIMPNLLDKRKVDHNYINMLLETVGLVHRKDHRPSQLSGGEQQRTAIARALANNPALLLADEPTGNLDSRNSIQIIELLRQININNRVTIVMVTHSEEFARQCDRIIKIKDGIIS